MTNSAEYARVHYAVRKDLGSVCSECGISARLEAALRPGVPAERLRVDPTNGCAYSLDPDDYFALCISCHRRLDLVTLRPTCKRGHDYTPDNTSVRRDGSRRCLTCHRDQEAVRLADPAARAVKRERDRAARKPLTAEQHARRIELQRARRARTQHP